MAGVIVSAVAPDYRAEILGPGVSGYYGLCFPDQRCIRLHRKVLTHAPRWLLRWLVLHECAHAVSDDMSHGPRFRAAARRLYWLPEQVGALALRWLVPVR